MPAVTNMSEKELPGLPAGMVAALAGQEAQQRDRPSELPAQSETTELCPLITSNSNELPCDHVRFKRLQNTQFQFE